MKPFDLFMDLFILRVSCKVSEAPRASLTLQESRSIHDSMNRSKIEFISEIYFSFPVQSTRRAKAVTPASTLVPALDLDHLLTLCIRETPIRVLL